MITGQKFLTLPKWKDVAKNGNENDGNISENTRDGNENDGNINENTRDGNENAMSTTGSMSAKKKENDNESENDVKRSTNKS